MRREEKLSLISFTFFCFIGLYIIIKFFFVLFWTLNFSPVFIIELTPFTVFNLAPLQLLVLSSIVAGYDAYLHFNDRGRHILYSFIPTSLMIAGIAVAIYNSHYNDPLYYAFFAILVGITAVDHRYILYTRYAVEEEEGIAQEPEEIESDLDMFIGTDKESEYGDEYEKSEEIWEPNEEWERDDEAGDFIEDLSKIEEGPEVLPEIVPEADTTAYEDSEDTLAIEELEDLADLFDESGNGKNYEEEDEGIGEVIDWEDLMLEEETEETRIKCPACGFMNEEGSSVCKVCGYKLEGDMGEDKEADIWEE